MIAKLYLLEKKKGLLNIKVPKDLKNDVFTTSQYIINYAQCGNIYTFEKMVRTGSPSMISANVGQHRMGMKC